jgi:Putative Ig domain
MDQWCSGDVLLGLGTVKYVQQLDGNGNPVLDESGNLIRVYVIQNGGQFKVLDSRGVVQDNELISDAGLAQTPACAIDPDTGDLWAAGGWTSLISHIRAPSGGSGHQLLGSIDLTAYTSTAGCADHGWARPGCGPVRSLVFDGSGNLYVGTDFGTNKIFKISKTGTILDTYTVPIGPSSRGPGWIDLAADQETMFYAAADGTIGVFNTNREPLPQALFDAGVEHLTDPVLDPSNVGLFGKIVVKNAVGTPLTGTPIYRIRLLPPGDGTGGLLVVYDIVVHRINLAGQNVQGYVATWSTPTRIAKAHVPTGVADVDPITGPGWTALGGLCVNRGYAAAVSQPDCTAEPTHLLCAPVPNCPGGGESPDCVAPGTPVLQQPPDQTNNEGDTITPLAIVASDPRGRPLIYQVSHLPQGLSFDPVTKTISGTVDWRASDALGLPAANVRVTVTNDRGLFARKWFLWTIDPVNAPASVTVSPAFPRDASAAYLVSTPRGVPISTVSLVGSDPDPCEGVGFYLYNGETLPAGLTLTAQEVSNPACTPGVLYPATITGTPTVEGVTTFTLKNGATNPLATFIWTVTGSAPTITAQVSPSPNAAGWHNSDVTVTFSCTGTGSLPCPNPLTVTEDGVHEITRTAANETGQAGWWFQLRRNGQHWSVDNRCRGTRR